MNIKITFPSIDKPSIKNYLSFRLFLLFFLILNISALAEIRYVSKTGSSTPPYTNWVTAADSIQKCINISQSGDTIYVANGTYKEYIRMIPNIALIGSGIDSCIIDTRGLTIPQFRAVIIKDSCLIEGFQIVVHYNTENFAGIYGNGVGKETIIRNNFIKDCTIGISFIQTSALVKDNIIANTIDGIKFTPAFSNVYPIVERNYITDCENGIKVDFPLNPTIRNNIIIMDDGLRGIFTFAPDSFTCLNNLVIANNAWEGLTFADAPGPINNNLVFGDFSRHAIGIVETNIVYNNNIIGGIKGVSITNDSSIIYKYNNIWNVEQPYLNQIPDTTNISVDPMFVDKEDLDFHLQMFSPLIDAGNPNILDKDGSRSDIGIYGGPLGEIYQYQDLPPSIPENLQSNIVGDSLVSVSWDLNTEADFKNYNIYRDTVSGFTIDSLNFIFSTDTSYFEDLIKGVDNNIYYKVTAVDNQSKESMPGDEVAVIITNVEQPKVKTIGYYHLFQNYPNPFNPETTIGYRLKEAGYVKLRIYDIKGELIEELVNEYKGKGYHEIKFNAHGSEGWKNKLSGLASGIYLYKIDVIDSRNIPVYSQINKMILVK